MPDGQPIDRWGDDANNAQSHGVPGVNAPPVAGASPGAAAASPSVPSYWLNQGAQGNGNGLLGVGQNQYGGLVGGANAYNSAMMGNAQNALQQQAPQADLTNANQDRGQYQGLAGGAQSDALGLYGAAARGQGPSAAQAQFNQNLNQSMLSNLALANSARGGGAALAAAQQGATMQNTQMSNGAALQAAQLRAQEQQAAMQGYAQQSLGMGAQSLQAQQQDTTAAMDQAKLKAAQEALNQQGALSWAGLGQNALNAQLAADTSAYATNAGLAGTSMQVGASQTNAAMGAGAGLLEGGLMALAA